jgi:ubiquinol-cytochrome c reductase cytochrome c1 subunit
MKKTLLLSLLAAALTITTLGSAQAAGGNIEIQRQEWSWDGVFGSYDRAESQRGLQVYREVCAGCHGLRFVAFRNLMQLGYSENQVKALAAEYEVTDGPNDEGEMFERPARPSDRFPSPFPNDNAARASNNGALPPDLSLIVDNRAFGMDFVVYPINFQFGGADYVYALLTGYGEPPADMKIGENMYYNKYYGGHQIAMAAPLSEDAVEYTDGTKATVEQMARDVTTFLAWATEPNLEERKQMGLKVVLFLIVFMGLMIAVKKRVWANVH